MNPCPLYNGQNLNFTGNANPYGLIQSAGRRKRIRRRTRRTKKRRVRKTRKYRR
jgi:hypothetical protein